MFLLVSYLLTFMIPVFCRMNYTGYKLLQISPTSNNLDFVENLMLKLKADVWKPYSKFNGKLDVLIPPEAYIPLEKVFKSKDIEFTVLNHDIQRLIDDERKYTNTKDRNLSSQNKKEFPFDMYHPFRQIINHLFKVKGKYPEIVKVKIIGNTYEHDPIIGLKIGSRGRDKPAILIDACYHAREWVTASTALYIINQLVSGYDNDITIRDYVDTFDWYVFPVMNPDGYRYTWRVDRLWRKNRSRASADYPRCVGVDLNRNFPVKFGGAGTSNDSCSNMYPGPSPFSEFESRATRDFILKHKSSLKSYVTLHSYSQLWMTPNSYTKELPPDYGVLKKALDKICPTVRATHGQNYTCGSIANVLYNATGTSTDWAYIDGKIVYSFVVEERDRGEYGFLLPVQEIVPASEEVWAGIDVLAKILKSKLKPS